MIDNILLIIFFLLAVFYLNFLLDIYRGLNKLSGPRSSINNYPLISVIIPFRNEKDFILNNLESIKQQNYPKEKIEVLYINDQSDDGSFEMLEAAEKPSYIKLLSLPRLENQKAYKKQAVKFGIDNSSGDIIVTTDADCYHPESWLTNIISCFDSNTGFVSGPVDFIDNNTFFSKLQKIEFESLIFAGAGLIGIEKPVICSAANIAYRKNLFENVGGFQEDMNLSSGDDELLMQKIASKTGFKIKFCLSKEATVYTRPNKNMKQFYQQRKRWASKGLFYSDKLLIVKLTLIFLFYVSLLIQTALAVFASPIYWGSLMFSFFIKASAEFIIMQRGYDLLFSKKMIKYFFPAELLQIPYIIIAGISGAAGNFEWKDRELKR